jgi:thiol:disulfide interchange protein
MRVLPRHFPVPAVALLGALSLLGSAFANDRPDFSGWFDNVRGMAEAGKLYEQEPQPIFVYFYTDWCGYCRQFERELLSSDEVESYLEDIMAVRVNPETSPAEAEIAQRYGVTGFPTLFVLSGESKTLSEINRHELVDGRPVLKSPAAFIDALKVAGAR